MGLKDKRVEDTEAYRQAKRQRVRDIHRSEIIETASLLEAAIEALEFLGELGELDNPAAKLLSAAINRQRYGE